jgi:hypothetical protein
MAADNKRITCIQGLALSASLAKNMAQLLTPRVPFFLPFLSISETAEVLMVSALALEAVERTSSAGSTYVLAGGAGRGGAGRGMGNDDMRGRGRGSSRGTGIIHGLASEQPQSAQSRE